MHKTQVRRHKRIGYQAKQREVFKDDVGNQVIITGKITRIRNVVSSDFVGKSVLITDIKYNNTTIQHLWVHENEVINKELLIEGNILTMMGIVYSYSHQYCNKVLSLKYSLKDIKILGIIND